MRATGFVGLRGYGNSSDWMVGISGVATSDTVYGSSVETNTITGDVTSAVNTGRVYIGGPNVTIRAGTIIEDGVIFNGTALRGERGSLGSH